MLADPHDKQTDTVREEMEKPPQFWSVEKKGPHFQFLPYVLFRLYK